MYICKYVYIDISSPTEASESKKQLEANQREQKRKAGHSWTAMDLN